MRLMEPDSPPDPAKSGCKLRGKLFSVADNGALDFLSAMEGIMGDGAMILGEEPPFPATAQPGDLLLAFLYEGKVRMAFISKVEFGGGSDQEEGSSGGSNAKGDEEDDESDEEEEEEEGSTDQSITYGSRSNSVTEVDEKEMGSSSDSDAKDELDEELEEQSCRSVTDDSSFNSITETGDKEEVSDTKEEVKEKNRHLHIRIWQEYCVLVLFEGGCWKLTKQQPIHWLQENQIEETQGKIKIENERNEVNMTRNLDLFDLSRQMYRLGFSGRLVCSEVVNNFVTSELSPNIINYNITEVPGTGATSKVYSVDTEYAIKMMKLDAKFDDKDALQNKEPREVTILSSFRNSTVVTFFQAWAADGIYKSNLEGSSSSSEGDDDDLENEGVARYVAIQMEYCGGTLRDFLYPEDREMEDREMDVEEAWFLFKEITKAIQSVHRRGVIHRDLKPANIFFDYADGNTIKLGDFGHGCWAIQYAADEGGTPNRGTRGYCAPELDGEGGEKPPSPTDKADIYSLGIILVELFYLFRSNYSRSAVFKNLRAGQFPDPADRYWYGDVTLLKKLVASCPSQRPSADEILEYISNRQ